MFLFMYLFSSSLTGAIRNAALEMDSGSRWFATGDSTVTLYGSIELAQIDAAPGVTITASGTAGAEIDLPSGGKLVVKA